MPAYLKIENIGVCPPEGFTVLGVRLADTTEREGVVDKPRRYCCFPNTAICGK